MWRWVTTTQKPRNDSDGNGQEPEESAFDRFESLAKRLVAVPKDEIKRKEREQAKRKTKAKPAP
jgi:hypothetical protein